ncbi:MAG: 30S ribosomal protein S1 [Clostridia bacterium]|nr:30S ribosomal protein S1 [Clostridia bacterium]
MNKNYLPEGTRLATAENREACSSLSALERAMNTGLILEGMATMCDHSLCLHVDVGGFEGIIPYEEAVFNPDGQPVKDIAVISRVGKPVCFRVLGVLRDIGGDGPQLLLSRRAAQMDCCREYLADLIPGDILPARVTHLENFGAFVDIGCGLVSLLSVDCLSVSRIDHPRDRLYPGMKLRVAVKSIDQEHHRIYVTLRELLGTWEQNAARFEMGQTVTGIVRSVESYGVFVELAPNLAGLTELRDEHRAVAHTWVGQSAAVFIKSIVPERMKIKLVLIDTYPVPQRIAPPVYYIPDEVQHISHWTYSPAGCHKRVETVFGE